MRPPAKLLRWLIDGDPSVRYRVLRELLRRPEQDWQVVAAHRQIGRKGWAARILHQQLPDGQWDTPGTTPTDLYWPKYIATNWRLLVLSDLGLTRRNPRIARAVALFLRRFSGPKGGFGGSQSEVCFTGNAVRMLVRFGYLEHPVVRTAVDWLVRHQKSDGGWHCFRSRTGTLDGWEPMSAFAAIPQAARTPAVERAIRRGAEFFLNRGLLSEGGRRYAPWLRLHYPVHYYYDFLVGLDFLTALGFGENARLRPALDQLEAKRNRDGSWDLERLHPDLEDPSYEVRPPFYPVGLEAPGHPSRWITTTALTVLDRAGR